MAATQGYYPTASMPISMPTKSPYYTTPHPTAYSRISVSPPEAPESVTTSGVASYDPSATSSSYAGSASDYDSSASSGGAAGVDMLDYMSDRLNAAIDPLPLDRELAKQAQTSGELNAKTRELLQLQALAQRRLAATRANLADGIKAAKDVQRDLEWTQKRVNAINQRAARKYPAEYKVAAERYPAPVDC